MKNLFIVLLLLVGVSIYSQEGNAPKSKRDKGSKEMKSPEQRNQALLDRMTTELKLDTKQQEQIKPIIAEQSAKMEAMKAERMANSSKEMSAKERDALRAKRQEDKKATDAKLQAILTPEQFKKMKENEQIARDKMRGARENRAKAGNEGEN